LKHHDTQNDESDPSCPDYTFCIHLLLPLGAKALYQHLLLSLFYTYRKAISTPYCTVSSIHARGQTPGENAHATDRRREQGTLLPSSNRS
jgi:hypothetical protein